MREIEEDEIGSFKKVRGSRGTCNRNPLTFFHIAQIVSVVLDFYNETWDYVVIWIHVFNNTNKHRLLH
jgi:hypothetical protein